MKCISPCVCSALRRFISNAGPRSIISGRVKIVALWAGREESSTRLQTGPLSPKRDEIFLSFSLTTIFIRGRVARHASWWSRSHDRGLIESDRTILRHLGTVDAQRERCQFVGGPRAAGILHRLRKRYGKEREEQKKRKGE